MKILAIDFDGTIVHDTFPAIGTLKAGAKENINKLYHDGYEVIIWTSRTHIDLLKAIDFLNTNGIKFHRVNQSSPFNMAVFNNKDTRKIFAHMYIDDKGLLNPLPHWDEIYNIIINRIPLYDELVARDGFL